MPQINQSSGQINGLRLLGASIGGVFILLSYMALPGMVAPSLCPPHTLWAISAKQSQTAYLFAGLVPGTLFWIILYRCSGLTITQKSVFDKNKAFFSTGALVTLAALFGASLLFWFMSVQSYSCLKQDGVEIHAGLFTKSVSKNWNQASYVKLSCGFSAKGGAPWTKIDIVFPGVTEPLSLGINYQNDAIMVSEIKFIKKALANARTKYGFAYQSGVENCPANFYKAVRAAFGVI